MQRIVCLGDSITAAKDFPEGHGWPAILQRELETVASGKYEIYNRGIGGNTSAQGLERFESNVKVFLPGIVLIEFGLNDASYPPGRAIARCGLPAFESNLGEIARLTRNEKGTPVFLANHPIAANTGHAQGNSRSYFQNFKPYQAAIRKVAKALKAPLIDLEKAMNKANVEATQLLSEDGVHLSREGNRLYAAFVLEGLKPILKLR